MICHCYTFVKYSLIFPFSEMLFGGELDSCGSLASFPEINSLSLVWFVIINNLLRENPPDGLQSRETLDWKVWGHECKD